MGEKPKKRVRVKSAKGKKLKPGRILLVLGVLIYFVTFFHAFFGEMLKTYVVSYGSIEDSKNVTGFIIKNEKVIKSGDSGTIKPVRNEGDRVPKGAVVATVYRQSVNDLQNKISQIDEKIRKAAADQAKNNMGTQIFSDDIRKLNDDTEQKITELCSYINYGDFNNVLEIKSGIDDNIKKKAEISGELGPASQYINGLLNEKSNLEASMSSLEDNIRTDTAGIVSYNIDGFENTLVPGRIPSIDINQLESLSKQQDGVNKQVSGIKIIDNFDCYVLVILQNCPELKDVKVGKTRWLRFLDTSEDLVPAYIDNITDKGQGKFLVAFRVDQDVEELIKYRKVNVDVVWSTYKGLKIPASSLIQKDGQEGVMAVKANYAQFEPVEVINKNNDFAIIKEAASQYDKGISLYDEIVVNGAIAEEGRQVRKWN